ncbi:hypothetical protein M9H77_31012 [Catharanthus roseus]|uniref:Uncharacterized protein n=1 Tax=Catharanthus roseus TaxID=4058 RepID=A0ACC0A0Q3_CATRO|nr:hypothetical protein M9H77_31012 [Catharanthus roseus]
MVSISGTLGCTSSQHDIQQTFQVQLYRRRLREPLLDRGTRGVKRGTRRLPDRGARRHRHTYLGHEVERGKGSGGGRPPIDPLDSPILDMSSFSLGLTPPSQFRICLISLTIPYIFRVFIFSCTSSSGHSRFIYTASAYIVCIFI